MKTYGLGASLETYLTKLLLLVQRCPGVESQWGRDFRTRPDRPWGPPDLLYNGYRVLPGGQAAGAWR